MLASADPHPQLQTLEPIQAPHALLVHRPALTTQHDVNTLVAESWSGISDLPYPQPECRLILRFALAVIRSTGKLCQSARPDCAYLKLLLDPANQRTALGWLQSFFRTTSPRMCLSRVRSATTRFSRAFSSRSCRSSRNSVRSSLPYFFFQ